MLKWKLNRTQKVLRNFLLTAVALVSLWWMLEFPVLTTDGLLRRAEQAYLLEEKAELLYQKEWPANGRLMAAYEDRLMTVGYSKTILGKRFVSAMLFEPEVRHILYYETEHVTENGKSHWYPHLELWGRLEHAASAEMEWTVKAKDGLQMTRLLQGERQSDFCVSFTYQRQYPQGEESQAAQDEERILLGDYVLEDYSAVIRFYSGDGELLETYHFADVGYGTNIPYEGGSTP